MRDCHTLLQDIFQKAFHKTFAELGKIDVEITESTQEKFGDYQCNSAMKLSKKIQKNPRVIAQEVLENIPENAMIEKLEIAGPGFINIFLRLDFLEEHVNMMEQKEHFAIDLPPKKEKVIIDFSSPNIAKSLHVGHLRSTIIGDSLARLFEFLGYEVLRLNHVGDWGTSFGLLIAFLKRFHPDVLTSQEQTDLDHLVSWYKESKKLFDSDAAFKKEAQLEVVALQGGNEQSLQAWKIICDISRKAFEDIYDILDIHLIERGESFYNPWLSFVVEEMERQGLVQESDGAKCVFMEEFVGRDGNPLPMIIQKSDGGYNYDTTDVAALWHRVTKEQGKRLIYVTDAGQGLHFRMLFKACELAQFYDPKKVRLDHVPFGLVLGSDGKKFRTREGDTEPLSGLIYAAIEKAEQIMKNKKPEMEEKKREKLAKAIGIAAIKYADLSCNRVGDYLFSYDKMLKFEGNTAAFLLYAYVRVFGIKRKIDQKIDTTKGTILLKEPTERRLGLHLLRFSEVLQQVSNDLMPNRLCDYLYKLAVCFNQFYRDCPVNKSVEQNSRLLLCELTARILKLGLHLLGVEVVEEM